jgi:hypothetical protein
MTLRPQPTSLVNVSSRAQRGIPFARARVASTQGDPTLARAG